MHIFKSSTEDCVFVFCFLPWDVVRLGRMRAAWGRRCWMRTPSPWLPLAAPLSCTKEGGGGSAVFFVDSRFLRVHIHNDTPQTFSLHAWSQVNPVVKPQRQFGDKLAINKHCNSWARQDNYYYILTGCFLFATETSAVSGQTGLQLLSRKFLRREAIIS